MTLNLYLKMLPIGIILELVITANQNIFWVSFQCVDINLKPTDMFFKTCLIFLGYFLLFLEANIKLNPLNCALRFWYYKLHLWRLSVPKSVSNKLVVGTFLLVALCVFMLFK